MYRHLTDYEIEALINQRCVADNWSNIEVVEGFLTANIKNVSFSGYNLIGKFETTFQTTEGRTLHAGIYNATIHGCIVGDNVYISNINDVIANYDIKEGSFISNIGTISCSLNSSFGNGVMLSPVNENGGRRIPIFECLSAQLAYMLVFYREKKEFVDKISNKILKYAEDIKSKKRGTIGEKAQIVNCKTILDVNVGSYAIVYGAEHLENGSVISRKDAITVVGTAVIAKDFIFAASSNITQGAIIERCFIGEGTLITKGFSAVDCLIFANCEFANGEAVSVFAAPYTVCHHKSSLLIACAVSFANIGSGTNMSNHAYKMGAIHQSVAERGCKFGSNSYLLSPSHIGSYTMILGSHKNHPDTNEMPFSYLIEEDGHSILIPGINMFRIGTIRDVNKWEIRDRRTNGHLDFIINQMLNPYLINKIERAIDILQQLQNQNPEVQYYQYKNCKIHRHSLKKAIGYYQDAITVFLGDNILENNTIDNFNRKNYNSWIDLCGLVVPMIEIERILDNPDKFDIINNNIFKDFFNHYRDYLNIYLKEKYNLKDEQTKEKILHKYIDTLHNIEQRLHKEANSEFFGDSQISYGVDFPEQRSVDFAEVTNRPDNKQFVERISIEIKNKIKKAKTLC